MRDRRRILDNLDELYRGAFERAVDDGNDDDKARLDFHFQRDQLFLEAVLDVRDLLAPVQPAEKVEEKAASILEKAQALRRLTKLR